MLNQGWAFISFEPFTPSLLVEFDRSNYIIYILPFQPDPALLLKIRYPKVYTFHFWCLPIAVLCLNPKKVDDLLGTHK